MYSTALDVALVSRRWPIFSRFAFEISFLHTRPCPVTDLRTQMLCHRHFQLRRFARLPHERMYLPVFLRVENYRRTRGSAVAEETPPDQSPEGGRKHPRYS